ncbi:hypothetical protein [Streptomyces caeruleatus]|uniref:hypothetical protein n=1 Tax=Streptomyces caeruleatus TaxID=661399 RepID=UPI00131E40A8|nr:hypothetical protein [Streptomyces caeruleatus]
MPSAAAGLVLDLCEELIDGYARRRGPMPVVVVHAAGQAPESRHDQEVRELVELVHRAQKPRWLLSRRVAPPTDQDGLPTSSNSPSGGEPGLDHRAYAAATALVKNVAEGVWENHNRSQYRPYGMPRSQLLAALDQALSEQADTGDGVPDARAVVATLAERRWQPSPRREPTGFWRMLGTTLSPTTALGAAVVACLGVLAAKLDSWPLTFAMLTVLLVPAAGYWIRRWMPPLSMGSGCRWLATTTFPLTLSTEAPVWSLWHPRLSRATLEERAVEVVRQMLTAAGFSGTADAGEGVSAQDAARQFCLQLRTLALLEDLRENHRPAWDLRHRKRTVPPLLIIPRASRDNGALPFLRAISDVRSRRSEQDPLLVVAGVGHGDLAGLRERTPLPLPTPDAYRRDPAKLYETWVERSLRTGQAPSMNAALPWVMPVALTGELLTPYNPNAEIHRRSTCRVRRSPWLLWSRWTLVAGCVLTTTGAATYYDGLTDSYCGGPEVVWNRDLVRKDGECVGVVTGSPLPVDEKARELGAGGKKIGLKELQDRIAEANEALAEDKPYVTVVFAGALTARPPDLGEADDVVRQLAGVYLAQRRINDPKQTNDFLQMKVVIANGAQGMQHQKDMAARIVAYARRDPTVVGVVGMGIHTRTSEAALGELQKAGLAVIGTTNSATHLAERYHNYVSLAPTNSAQASALTATLGQAQQGDAVVLVPQEPGGANSTYSADQATSAEKALRDAGFNRPKRISYPLRGTSGVLDAAARSICQDGIGVVYFAGRSSHIASLMTELGQHTGCGDKQHPVTVLSGDDMTKKPFKGANLTFPEGVRLRYASLTYEKQLKKLLLYGIAKQAFGAPRMPTWQDELFTDGFAALSYDAAYALHEAAQDAGVPGYGSAPAVLAALHSVDFSGGATGHISFRNADVADPDLRGHGFGLYEVTQPGTGATLQVELLGGRPAGLLPLKQANCGQQDQEAPASSATGGS